MATALPELIDKQDNYEIIRDQIAAILLVNTTEQQNLATAEAKDPALWAFEVYTERYRPWEKWLNQEADQTPIVNVWFENSTFIESASNISERQKCEGIYNIDIYAPGYAQDEVGAGHKAADEQAALNSQRIMRLVRNILMAAENTYLQARGLVWQRWPQSITSFQPNIDSVTTFALVGMRLAFRVGFNELSPQVPLETLELLAFQLLRDGDGLVYFDAEYDYT